MGAFVEAVYYLEELAANAWPAEVVQLVDGWRLRFTPGVTSRRVNSVWPNNPGRFSTVNQKLDWVEAFYARRKLPARFQICPAAQPANLDEILAERGYHLDAPTFVQSVAIEMILERLPPQTETAVNLQTHLPDDWFNFQATQNHMNGVQAAARKAALNRIGPQAVFAQVEVDINIIGIGLGILERGWLGIFGMMTHPDRRRQGAATAVLRALAQWGQSQGAAQVYLQVMENNVQARPLYNQAGFATQYQYHYRQSP